MNFSLSIEDTPVSSISLSRSVARSRISPLFFALNSQLPQAIPSDSTLWLSLNANYNQASYTTFLEFSVDYGLPPTVDVMLGADFYDKCRTNMPLLAAVYSDESPAGHTSNVATTPFKTGASGAFPRNMTTTPLPTHCYHSTSRPCSSCFIRHTVFLLFLVGVPGWHLRCTFLLVCAPGWA
ncbi:hypothetical protein PM082_001191 [Marasmius tenuissimus]|nr:hypothetical protein PM082_001191 [Marasmius tenuissimus]